MQIYERITKNFNIFEFLDNQDNEGDDEFSSQSLDDDLDQFEENLQNNNKEPRRVRRQENSEENDFVEDLDGDEADSSPQR